jgi:hypothetical protein
LLVLVHGLAMAYIEVVLVAEETSWSFPETLMPFLAIVVEAADVQNVACPPPPG